MTNAETNTSAPASTPNSETNSPTTTSATAFPSITTTRTGRTPAGVKKPFAWSYSKLKNFETCPKRHWHIDIAKDVKEDESEQLQWGNEAHKALADRIKNGQQLPRAFDRYEDWAIKVLTRPERLSWEVNFEVKVEQQLAITKDFQACDWFGARAWYRGIADALKIVGPVALAIDWKTGKIVEDAVQLALMAQCVFAHYPAVQKVRTEYVWLKDEASSRADFTRADMINVWNSLGPRIDALEHAYNNTMYPAKPGGLCKRWCPIPACPYHGVGA